MKNILIYGTIARPHDPLGLMAESYLNGKRSLKWLRDASRSRLTGTLKLDYRDYDAPYPSNVGDIAISDATRKILAEKCPGRQFTDVNWEELSAFDPERLQAEHDLIVFAGSGYFFFSQRGTLAARVKQDCAFLESVKTPAILFGVGVNHPYAAEGRRGLALSSEDEDCLRRLLGRMNLISVRDAASQALLSRYTDKPVHLIGDPALHLDSRTSDFQPSVDAPVIGVNFAFHGPLSNTLLLRNLDRYCVLLQELRDKTGCRFRYFVHHDAERVIPNLLAMKGIEVETVSGGPTDLSDAYRSLDLHIGAMLHSCILAVGAGTPCIALAYDIKHAGFFDLLGLRDYSFDATSGEQLDKVAPAALSILDAQPVFRQRIRERRESLAAKADLIATECANLLSV